MGAEWRTPIRLPLLLLMILVYFLPAVAIPPSSSDAEALSAFKSKADLNDRLNFSNMPCRWPGVLCSDEGRVIRLVLESSALHGTLAGAIDQLDQLRVLSLKGNALSGPIPGLSGLVNLKALFLDHNFFTGPFPASVLSLHRLRTLDLSHNRLAGPIPLPLAAALDRLNCLRLDSNRFNGSVPPLNQSSLRVFNVSDNDLSGAVPVTALLSSFDASAFSGNPGLCGEAVRRECRSHFLFFHAPSPTAAAVAAASPATSAASAATQLQGLLLPGSASRKRRKKAEVVIGFLSGAFFVAGMVGLSVAMKRRGVAKKKGRMLIPEKDAGVVPDSSEAYDGAVIEGMEDELVKAAAISEEKVKRMGKSGCLMFCAGEASVYSLEQLMRASAELLGRGSVGTTYKAVLDNRLIVCVKRLEAGKMGAMGKEGFERHMDAVGRLRHPNLVPLRSYFHAKEERLLVYDYQPNGSLFSLIHGSRSTRAKPLHWTSCLKIAEDVAQGLAYIHQASRLVHGNLKSSNVLLGADFEACLTDNCLSLLAEPSDDREDESGYRAPETRKSNRGLTPRSDIYAFGVLLLELLTGKPPLEQPIGKDLIEWVRLVREEGAEDERLTMITGIAAACVRSSPESRPTTWQVLKMIQEVKEADTGDNDEDESSSIS